MKHRSLQSSPICSALISSMKRILLVLERPQHSEKTVVSMILVCRKTAALYLSPLLSVTWLIGSCGTQVLEPHVRAYYRKLRQKKQNDTSNTDEMVHPVDPGKPLERPLGVVKLVLRDIQLVDQPFGAYFLVFKYALPSRTAPACAAPACAPLLL